MALGNLELFSDAKMCHQEPDMSEKLSPFSELLSMVMPSTVSSSICKHIHPHMAHHFPFSFPFFPQ
ncbi:hypothetical protein LguiA_006950 [Lonicera macranthoides]